MKFNAETARRRIMTVPMVKVIAAAALIVLAFGAYWLLRPGGSEPGQPGSSGSPPAPAAVEMAPVKVDVARREIIVVGALAADESVIIRPEIAGRITSIDFAEGKAVNQGDVLFRLDDIITSAELEQAQANLNLAKRNFERADELFRKGAGTARALDEARASLEANVAAVTLGKARRAKTVINAPFRGVTGLRLVSVGGYVVPGQDMVNLESINPLKANFRVPEVFLRDLKAGQAISITVDAFPGETFPGEVYAIDPLIDAGGRSVALRARLENPGERLRPGLFTRVALIADERQDAIFVPEQAIVPHGHEHFVFKVVDGKAVRVKVVLGIRRQGNVEVRQGLAAGDILVAAGHLRLKDGAPVKAADNPAPAAK